MPDLDPQAFRDRDWSLEQFERRQEWVKLHGDGGTPMTFETDIDKANKRIQELEAVKSTPIQKEIEANNIEMGRKLLAYPIMLGALRHAAAVLAAGPTFPDTERIAALRVVLDAIAKAGKTP